MKRRFLAALLALILVIGLCACSNSDEKQPDQTETPDVSQPSEKNTHDATEQPDVQPDIQPDENQDTPPANDPEEDETNDPVALSDVRSAMVDQLGIADPLLLESDMLEGLYGITADMLTQAASFVTMSGTFPDEVILTEAVDDAAAEAVAAALQKRLDEVLVQSKTYDAENYEAAQQCKVARNGLFVALILSPKQSDMTAIYEGFFA